MIRVLRYWRPADGSIDWEKAHAYARGHEVPPEFLGFIRRWLEPNKGDLFPADHEIVGYCRSRQESMAWVWWRPVTVEGRSECRALELTGPDLESFEASGADVYRLLGIAEARPGGGAFPRSGGAWPSYLGAAAASFRSRFGPGRAPGAFAYLSFWEDHHEAAEPVEIEYHWRRGDPAGPATPRSRVTHPELADSAMETIERHAVEEFRRQAGWDRDLPPLPEPGAASAKESDGRVPGVSPATPPSLPPEVPSAPGPAPIPAAASGSASPRVASMAPIAPVTPSSGGSAASAASTAAAAGAVEARIEALQLEIRQVLRQVESRVQTALERSVPGMIKEAVEGLRGEVAAVESRLSVAVGEAEAAASRPPAATPPAWEESVARLKSEIEALRRELERVRREPSPLPPPLPKEPAARAAEPRGDGGGRGVERAILGLCVLLGAVSVGLPILRGGGKVPASSEALFEVSTRLTNIETDLARLKEETGKGLGVVATWVGTLSNQVDGIRGKTGEWTLATVQLAGLKAGQERTTGALEGVQHAVEALERATSSWAGWQGTVEKWSPEVARIAGLTAAVDRLERRLDELGRGGAGGPSPGPTNPPSGVGAGSGRHGERMESDPAPLPGPRG